MIVKRIALGLLALVIGAFGIVPLIGIGEATGTGLTAYAVDTVIFASIAYVLTRLDPAAWPLYAGLLCAPIFILSMGIPGSGESLLAVLMTALTAGAAFLAWASQPKPAA